nr:MAG TPA: hypothetical protein [Caudoviricetes sp.]
MYYRIFFKYKFRFSHYILSFLNRIKFHIIYYFSTFIWIKFFYCRLYILFCTCRYWFRLNYCWFCYYWSRFFIISTCIFKTLFNSINHRSNITWTYSCFSCIICSI